MRKRETDSVPDLSGSTDDHVPGFKWHRLMLQLLLYGRGTDESSRGNPRKMMRAYVEADQHRVLLASGGVQSAEYYFSRQLNRASINARLCGAELSSRHC